MRLDRFARRHPLGASLAAILVTFVVMGLASALAAGVLGTALASVEAQTVGRVAGGALVVVLLRQLGWLERSGVASLGDRRLWLVTAAILLYTVACAFLAFFGTLAMDLSVDAAMAPTLLGTGLAGVTEELLFRGAVLAVLVRAWGGSRRGLVAGVVVSAACFGAVHLLNLAAGDSAATGAQALEAGLSAVLYGALVVSGRSLWPAVALHSLVNVAVNLAAENTAGFVATADHYTTFTLLQAPTLLYGLYLLWTTPLQPDVPMAQHHGPHRSGGQRSADTSGGEVALGRSPRG